MSPSSSECRLPTLRTVTFFLIRRPDRISTVEQKVLVQIHEATPEIAIGYTLFQLFAPLLRNRADDLLFLWTETINARGLAEFQAFTTVSEKDLAAVEPAANYIS